MSDLMIAGLELAVLGMGTVFIFLIALVAATGWMSRIVLAMAPAPAAPLAPVATSHLPPQTKSHTADPIRPPTPHPTTASSPAPAAQASGFRSSALMAPKGPADF